jgi:hypothetical protein
MHHAALEEGMQQDGKLLQADRHLSRHELPSLFLLSDFVDCKAINSLK